MEDVRAPASGAALAGHGDAEPSGSGSGDGNDVSAFASPEFDPVGFLNRLFPDESSLAGVDPLVQKLRLRVRRVDDEILNAVRSQSTGGARAKADLEQSMSAIGELEHRVKDIKAKAETSELTVRDICADVKKLDFAKKHLTSTITSLRRLSMLVAAVDQLERFASIRAYKESANLLDAVNELAAHFANYSDVPKVAELKRRRDDCESALRAAVFEDFHVNWQPSVVESDELVSMRLRDALFSGGRARPETPRGVDGRPDKQGAHRVRLGV
jgi:predicted  nucleic acid-binding Zn-ribbon protein